MSTAGRIPKEFIDQLLTRIDIVEVIGARIALKKAGREYMACCPFHNEKTPSFTVSPTKQFYHCFGCGVHGSVISFLMEYEHLDYIEAIEALARTIGVQIPREGAEYAHSLKRNSASLYQLLEAVATWYQQQLMQSAEAKHYLKSRELSVDIIQRFALGFAPQGWDNILTQFTGYNTNQLIASGLVIRQENGRVYDRFRQRIMFPIRDKRGRIIGFGGRVIGEDIPKYLNSPETELFHKGSELYGIYEARLNTRQLQRLVVVEGYMDVIALAQFGINYAVATLGTATTSEQVKQLFKVVPEVIFCFDGDRAGKQAAWRALENTLPELTDDRHIKFLFLPKGEDPDSYIRKNGKEAFEIFLEKSLSLTKFFLVGLNDQLGFRENYTLNVTEDRARFIKEAANLLAKMPDILQKKQLMPELVRLGYVEAGQENLLKKYSQNTLASPLATKKLTQQEIRRTPMRHAIALLLNYPRLVVHVGNPEQWARYDVEDRNLLLAVLEIIEVNPTINTAAIVEHFRETEFADLIAQISRWDLKMDMDEAVIERDFAANLARIKRDLHKKRVELLLHRAQIQGLTDQEQHDLMCLLTEIH